MSRRTFVFLVALVGAATVVRVGSTGRVFAQVIDEPAHVIAGYEWLSSGDYRRVDIEHPPLARVMAALPLWMSGATAPSEGNWTARGNALLLSGGRYVHNLALTRSGNLLFLIVAIAAVAAWGSYAAGHTAGLIAAIMFVSLPPVLGHAGVATTDMAAGATVPLALFTLMRWLDRRRWRDALLLGVSAGAGLLSKFSFLLFFPAGAMVIVAMVLLRRRSSAAADFSPPTVETEENGPRPAPTHGRWASLLQLTTAIAASILIVWGGYRFTSGTVASTNMRAQEFAGWIFHGRLRDAAVQIIERVPVPAPLFFNGLLQVKLHDLRGHPAYLFGQTSANGWWYYFPVALLFKTPLPFLALGVIGALRSWRSPHRHGAEAALVAIAILAAAMTASINIGIRHLLPLYAPLAVAAAVGVAALWQRGAIAKAAASLLMAWTILGSAFAHPDYIAWFNELAGSHPEHILADSNLDWGQDVLRLRAVVAEEHIQQLTGVVFTSVDLAALGIPPVGDIDSAVPARGWVVVSETPFQLAGGEETFRWLRGREYRRIGRTIRLYRLR